MDQKPESPSCQAMIGGLNVPSGTSTALPAANPSPMPEVPGVCPKVLKLSNDLIAQALTKGLKVGVFSGLRPAAESARLYALGRTIRNPDGAGPDKFMGDIVSWAQPWQSWHNYGLAFDLAFVNEKGKFWWPADESPHWQTLGAMGEGLGLIWGGRWPKPKTDFPHFELRGKILGVKMAKEILFEKGIETLWKMATEA